MLPLEGTFQFEVPDKADARLDRTRRALPDTLRRPLADHLRQRMQGDIDLVLYHRRAGHGAATHGLPAIDDKNSQSFSRQRMRHERTTDTRANDDDVK